MIESLKGRRAFRYSKRDCIKAQKPGGVLVMPFASVLSTEPLTQAAVEDCLARADWHGPVDMAMAFFAPAHRRSALTIAQTLSAALKPRCLLGCQGETVVGNDREVEQAPALSLWLGRWSAEIELAPFHLTMEETAEGT